MESSRSHVVFIAFPVLSHINPMLHFAKRLVSKGVDVTLAAPHSIIKSIEAHEYTMKTESFSDGWDGGFKTAPDVEAYVERFGCVGLKNITKLIQMIIQNSHSPVKCLIYSSLFPSVLNVAKHFGFVGAAFFVTPCSANAIHYQVHQGHLSIPVEGPTVSLQGLPLLETRDLPTTVTNKDSIKFLQFCLNQFSSIDQADWLFFNSLDVLEGEVVQWLSNQWPEKVLTVGSCVPTSNHPNASEPVHPCIEWLNTKEAGSVVYVSFGSVFGPDEEQSQELAWGLKRSNKYFLWVLGAAAEETLPVELKEEISEKGFVVQWCPQLEVLAHKAVGCFVTHGGWNSALEAISLGVPMVVMPVAIDHTTVAKFTEDVWKVGVRVKRDEKGVARREETENCINHVMLGGEIKRNAAKLKVLVNKALSEGGSSDRNTDKFLKSL